MIYFDDLGSTLIKYFQKSKDIAKIYLIYGGAADGMKMPL